MDPLTLGLASGAVLGGINLLGGLFGASAEREEQRRGAQQSLAQNQMQMTQGMLQGEREGAQGALSGLIQAYRQGLGG